MTVCDKFEPTILEGQLCYSLDIANIVNKSTGTKTGRTNGLRILVDPNPFRLNVSNRMNPDDQSPDFKVYVHTLSQHTAYGAGAFAMSALKRMAGTGSFKQLPEKQKNCRVHNREDCETKQYLDQVRTKCGCIPWALDAGVNKKKVDVIVYFLTSHLIFTLWSKLLEYVIPPHFHFQKVRSFSSRCSPTVGQGREIALKSKLWKMRSAFFLALGSMLML